MDEKRDLRVIFETIAGSRLYGTATALSDLDVRGVAIPRPRFVFGVERFNQLEDRVQDRVIYSLHKFFKLAEDANPNIIELLFAPETHWRKMTAEWFTILDHRHLFLSKKAKHTFSGYAYSQLRRIKNHKKWLDAPPTKPARESMGLSVECAIQEDALKALATVPRAIIGDLTNIVHKEIEYAKQKEGMGCLSPVAD